jgi:hypothetical protein
MNARANSVTCSNHSVRPIKPGPNEATFGDLPVIASHLFSVNSEVPSDHLLQHAQCLARGLRDTFLHADDGIDGDRVWMIWNSLDQMVGLLDAIELAGKDGSQ